MPTTTNYGWTTPADTDLVKDGAAAIRTLGNSVDTTTKNLNPETTLGDISYRSSTANTNTRLPIGTTGQVLTVVGGVPAWSSETGDITEVQAGTGISVASGTGPIPVVTNTVATTFDAKGDLVAGTGADTFAKLTVGANDTVLTADSTTATGLKWATPASGGMTLISTTTLSGTTTSITVASNSYKDLVLVFRDAAQTGNTNLGIRINNIDSADTYLNRVSGSTNGSAFNYSTKNTFMVLNAAGVDGYGTNAINGSVTFFDANSTKNKLIFGVVAGKTSTNAWGNIMNSTAAVETSAVISDIDVCSFDTFTLSGTALLYGVS